MWLLIALLTLEICLLLTLEICLFCFAKVVESLAIYVKRS
jgi:hypothetical protein